MPTSRVLSAHLQSDWVTQSEETEIGEGTGNLEFDAVLKGQWPSGELVTVQMLDGSIHLTYSTHIL